MLFRSGDHRLTYNIQASTLPVKFWGLGYDAADRNPRTRYTRDDCSFDVRYMRRIAGGFSVGATFDLRYAAARSVDERGAAYIAAAGQRRSAISTGLGVAAEWDTRDSREGVLSVAARRNAAAGIGRLRSDAVAHNRRRRLLYASVERFGAGGGPLRRSVVVGDALALLAVARRREPTERLLHGTIFGP